MGSQLPIDLIHHIPESGQQKHQRFFAAVHRLAKLGPLRISADIFSILAQNRFYPDNSIQNIWTGISLSLIHI